MKSNVVNPFLVVSFHKRGFIKPRKVWSAQTRGEERDLSNRELSI